MAKRFTDTDKWKKPWFTELPSKMKIAWEYLRDNCDHAGIWPGNWKLICFQTGETITEKDCIEFLGPSRFVPISEGKYYLPTFIEFQYGELNPLNRAHQSVIQILIREGVNKPLERSLQGRKDKDKDMDKDKEKDKDKDKKPNFNFETLYQKYPRKEGKQQGLKICKQQVKTPEDYDAVSLAIDRYVSHCRSHNLDPKYIKHFGTFMASWRDWLDPLAGQVKFEKPNIPTKPFHREEVVEEINYEYGLKKISEISENIFKPMPKVDK